MRVLQNGKWIEVELDLSTVQREVHTRPPYSSTPRIAVMGPIIERIARMLSSPVAMLIIWFRPSHKEHLT